MRLSETLPDENYPAGHLVSEHGCWEMGFRPMLFGVRVSASLVGDGGISLDYCAGASPVTQLLLHRMVRLILEDLPETITGPELRALLPTYERRLIDRDEHCWARLTEMAASAKERRHADD